MQTESSRALRRHHIWRLKQKRIKYGGSFILQDEQHEQAKHLGRLVHTATLCSCWMCGNPRRHLGEATLQEKRSMEILRCELIEIVEGR